LKLQDLAHKIRVLLTLMRIRNALIAFVGVTVGAALYTPDIPVNQVLLAGLSAACVLSGGNIINDYFDIEADKTNKPWRPVPSGHISMSDTLMLAIVFFMAGVGISHAINKYCLAVAILNTVILILYARYSKRLLLVSNLSISYLVASVFVYGALSTVGYSQTVAGGRQLLAVVVACSFLMTLAREIVKDIEDIEGDSRVYATSIPIKIGEKKSSLLAASIGVLAVAASLTPIFQHAVGFNTLAYTIFIIIADLIFLVSFTMHPALAQRTMVAGMALSLIAFLSGSLVMA
jgi:geranylgeranylglycerol-phosphate geranylgeranyltransferase